MGNEPQGTLLVKLIYTDVLFSSSHLREHTILLSRERVNKERTG